MYYYRNEGEFILKKSYAHFVQNFLKIWEHTLDFDKCTRNSDKQDQQLECKRLALVPSRGRKAPDKRASRYDPPI